MYLMYLNTLKWSREGNGIENGHKREELKE